MTTYGVDRGNVAGGSGASSTPVLASGIVPLTADWDAGSFEIRAQTFESDVATGTAPFVVASSTKVTNLNADYLDGAEGTYYLEHGNFTGLADDDHTQYALLAGRATGQVITGGTASGDDLTLRSTSHGTKGDIILADAGGDAILGGGATASKLKFLEPSGSGSNYSSFAAQAQAGNIDYTLPAALPTLNPGALAVSTAGAMSWASHQVGKNAILNGGFDVWQRGTSFASISAFSFTADRWVIYANGGVAVTASQSTDVPTVAQAGVVANYSLKVDITTADASLSAGDYLLAGHAIEGYTWRHFAQRALTLSFWFKSTKTGTYVMSVRNGGADRSYVAEFTVNSANTWEKKTVNISASPSAGTWNYTNDNGLSLFISLACGSTFQTTPNAWQTGNYYGTASAVNGSDSTSNDFYIALIQLELGDVATDFDIKPYPDELFRCQRYFFLSGKTNYSIVGTGIVTAATTARIVVLLKQEMRIPPTFAISGAGTLQLGNTYPVYTSISATYNTTNSIFIDVVAAGGAGTAGDAAVLYANNAATDYWTLDAEIAV